ncbi:nucleotide kinase [Lithospermum erythrorhizon]|uniref:Nucleotide kinase n=1 Tax=Lithospermum erythrorhizon TaxID=34254 RepID=A0AAV3PSM3_LITER
MQKLFRRSPCVLASSSLPLSTFPSFGVFKKMTILPSASLSPNNLRSSLQNKVTKVPFLSNGSDVGNALNCSTNSFKICTNTCKSCTCYVESCRGSDTLSNTFIKVPFSSSGSDVGKALSFSTKSCKSCTCYVGSCRGCGVGSGRAFSEVPFSSNSLDVGKALNFSTKSCGICTCALESCRGSRVGSGRAWGVLKGCKGIGGLNAWFGTLAGGGDDVEKDSFLVEAVGEEGSSSDENEIENVVESGKVARVNRRQRGGGSGGALLQGNPDLLTIPGVGPRNLRKLVEKGFDGVDQLKQFYKDKFFRESTQKMVEYLQSSVGIIHKSHAESITTFIKESVDKELKDDSSDSVLRASLKKRITLCVEGNISVGKTTFLQRIANETLELQDLVEVVPEPIDKWQNIGPDHFNILDAFYADPQRYAYTFQNYVFVTRVMQERESSAGLKPLRLMERSIFSDRMVRVPLFCIEFKR